MRISRRKFIERCTFGGAVLAVLGYRGALSPRLALAKARQNLRIGACDWSLKKEADPAALNVAKEAGLDGVEISCGKGEEKLPISDVERRKSYLTLSKKSSVLIPSTCLDILHRVGLKSDPKAMQYVEQGIEATKALGGKVVLLPFFGPQAIRQRAEQMAVADKLKALAPIAQKAGIVLGLETSLSAEDNVRIVEQVKSQAVKVYYDVGNSHANGFDVYKELPWLGKERICQLHLKDGNFLFGKGKINFPRLVESILKSGFDGWAMLESIVMTTVENDFTANASYVRGLFVEKKDA